MAVIFSLFKRKTGADRKLSSVEIGNNEINKCHCNHFTIVSSSLFFLSSFGLFLDSMP